MPDSPIEDQETMLERLARAKFGSLSEAEENLVRAVPLGKIANCAPRAATGKAITSDSCEEWGPQRQVRAGLIRWLCVDASAKSLIDPLGIQLWGAAVVGWLDLSFAKIAFPLAMIGCRLAEDINVQAAEVPDLNLSNTSVPGVEASGLQVKANVFLRNGFISTGEVRLLGARIGGDLDCRNACFRSSAPPGIPGGGFALSADRVEVGNGVFLNGGFRAEGEVRFPGARIRGSFSCSGGSFINPPTTEARGTCALGLDGIVVGGDLSLGPEFNAEGEVRLLGAQIGGNLDCNGAKFSNPQRADVAESGRALSADGVIVKECVFFTDSFQVHGDVTLLGAHVEKNFECIGSTFNGQLAMRGAFIGGGLHWLGIKSPDRATLFLDDASATRILDDMKSWPAKGNLDLDGFTYRRITQGPRDPKNRLTWLARQGDFTPQPYRQLAIVLRNEGDDSGARKVLSAMEHTRRKSEDRSWNKRLWSWALRWTIGYGYYPERALVLLLA
jgi:hypothetical protein